MSRLFISLYLDEDVSALIATLVRARAYNVLTTQEAGRVASSDASQLEFATSQQMAILTHNRDDFLELARQYTSAGKHHCGIIIAIRRSPYDITRRLLSLLDRMTAEEMDDQTLFI